MDLSWKAKAYCIVPETLLAVLLAINSITPLHPVFMSLTGLLITWMALSMLAYPRYAREYRLMLAGYIMPAYLSTLNWQVLGEIVRDMDVVWPTLVKLSIAGGIVLIFWQHLPRLRARVLL